MLAAGVGPFARVDAVAAPAPSLPMGTTDSDFARRLESIRESGIFDGSIFIRFTPAVMKAASLRHLDCIRVHIIAQNICTLHLRHIEFYNARTHDFGRHLLAVGHLDPDHFTNATGGQRYPFATGLKALADHLNQYTLTALDYGDFA